MIQQDIANWIKNYAVGNGIQSLVVGISGGIDSSVVSTLCAMTGLKTIVVQIPIRQRKELDDLSSLHAKWLLDRFNNVKHINVDLTSTFTAFENVLGPVSSTDQEPNPQEQLAWANSRSRLRMMTLYQIAQSHSGIVVGTGNKVEDFGVGFFTKYGDGGVDISPIADLMKTEVWAIGKELGIEPTIISAAPTDGLWDDGRVDQDQLGGLSYKELEAAMDMDENGYIPTTDSDGMLLYQYRKIRARNLHKMIPIPVFKKDNK